MHVSRWKAWWVCGLLLTAGAAGQVGAAGKRSVLGCSRVVVEGEVRSGERFRSGFGGGLDVVMEPMARGWVLRVVPTGSVPGSEDYAGLATPPYRSVSPLLVSTDFDFRAQDAVGWNPRRFRYAAGPEVFRRLEGLYRKTTVGGDAGAEGRLVELAAVQPEGVLEIVDAVLQPGTADQTAAAALLATHFASTAHRTETTAGQKATALGRVMSLRFRVKLNLVRGVKAEPGKRIEPYACTAQ